MNLINITFSTLATLLLWVSDVSAQTYSVDWHKIAGGGGTSTGGVYAVSGTIGQPDAGGPRINGPYSVLGGFWTLLTAGQTPGRPWRTLTSAGNRAILSESASAPAVPGNRFFRLFLL